MIFLPVFLQCGGEAVSLSVEKWEFMCAERTMVNG